jgi:hypothetical protein
MSLDPTTIISSLLGSLIGMIGAIAVAFLYIGNQNKSEKKKLLHDRIQKTYFEQGVFPIQAALSEYGACTTFALHDARIWVLRCLTKGEENIKLLEAKLNEILQRPTVMDVTSHNFSLAMKPLPILHKFGIVLYTSVVRTFQLYSSLLSDALSVGHLQQNIKEAGADEVARSLGAIAQIFDLTMMYLERRFTDLKDYFWLKDLESYDDFLEMFSENKYKTFLSVMEQYKEGVTRLMDAMTSSKSEERKETTLSFSKWLDKNLNYNPLE